MSSIESVADIDRQLGLKLDGSPIADRREPDPDRRARFGPISAALPRIAG